MTALAGNGSNGQNRRGRPITFTQSIAERICDLVTETETPIRQICKEIGVPKATLYEWADPDIRRNQQVVGLAEFPERFARAMRIRFQSMADDLAALADEDIIEGDRSDSARVQRQKLRAEVRQWMASRRLPELYGDRIAVDANVEFEIPDLRPVELVKAERTIELPAAKPGLPTGDKQSEGV